MELEKVAPDRTVHHSPPAILCLAVGKERLPNFPDEKVPAWVDVSFFLQGLEGFKIHSLLIN